MSSLKRLIGLNIFLVLILFTFAYGEKKKEPVGAIVSWQGIVKVYPEGAEKFKVRRMEGIYLNDIIVTEANSRVKLLMKDDSVLSLGPNASLKIRSYKHEEKKNLRIALFRVVGVVRAIAGSAFGAKGSGFQIETQTAIVGVKGTDFIVSAGDKDTLAVSMDGDVSVRNISPDIPEEVILESGFKTSVKQGLKPDSPSAVEKELLAQLVEETSIPVTHPIELLSEGCIGCHPKVFDSISKYEYGHPGAEGECARCHIKELVKEKTLPMDTFSDEGMIFTDAMGSARYRARVKVVDRDGKEAVSQKIDFIPSKLIGGVFDDKVAPAISELNVEDVLKGVFYSVAISFSTDKPARASLEYGVSKELGNTSKGPDYYTTGHRLMLDKLTPDDTVHVRAAAEDVFGNKTSSIPIKFKVKKVVAAGVVEKGAGVPEIKQFTALLSGKRVLLRWKANKPVRAQITLEEEIKKDEPGAEEPHYPGLKNLKESGDIVCEECHKGRIHKKASHPMGFLDWRKAEKPRGFVFGENSEFICVTCHAPHGGEYPHILRKKDEALCNACHLMGAGSGGRD